MSSAALGILGARARKPRASWARRPGHPGRPGHGRLEAPGCLGIFRVLGSAPWTVEHMLIVRDRLSFFRNISNFWIEKFRKFFSTIIFFENFPTYVRLLWHESTIIFSKNFQLMIDYFDMHRLSFFRKISNLCSITLACIVDHFLRKISNL
jgi:hypothetical protein